MKKLTLFILGVVLCHSLAFSQGCLPEGINFITQEQIDNFQTNYPGCTEIEGDVIINGWESNITNLNGLSVVTSIGGDLEVYNTSITNFNGLDALTFIGDSLKIGINDNWSGQSNGLLTSLTGLYALTTIDGALSIAGNPLLTSLNGLQNLYSVGGLNLAYTYLTNLSSLDNLNSIVNDLSVWSNPQLINLAGLENIGSINGDIYISHNSSFNNLTGLNGLTSIGGFLYFEDNDALNSLTGLDNINSIGYYLKFDGNDALSNFEGLEGLISVVGPVIIWSNNSMASVNGLDGLTSIETELIIEHNDALISLSALDNLTSVGGLTLTWNTVLPSLSGLDNINPETLGGLIIVNNWELSICDIQSICDYLAGPNPIANILLNAPGCNSQAEVEAACLTPIESIFSNKEISIYPNPGKDFLIISTQNGVNLDDAVIYNYTGQKVLQVKLVNNTLDISKLQPGMYIIELVTFKGKMRRKLIVE